MIRAIAIDDEIPALKLVENFCARSSEILLQQTFNKPTEAITYLKLNKVDLLFLDVNMPSISGIDLYKTLPHKTMLIFTTAYSEFAVEGFNLSAVDYLLKPFSYERFEQAVAKATEYYQYANTKQQLPEQFIFIRADYSLIKINLADILFIESLDDYLRIRLVNQKPIVARITMKAMMKQLPEKTLCGYTGLTLSHSDIYKMCVTRLFLSQVKKFLSAAVTRKIS